MLVRSNSFRHSLAVRRLHSFASTPAIAGCLTRPSLSAGPSLHASSTEDLRPWRPRLSRAGTSLQSLRTLATAIDDYKTIDDIPFEHLPESRYPLHTSQSSPRVYDLRPFDVSSPLMVRERSTQIARQRINTNGIPGDPDEMLSLFDACLQVGKLHRASLILKRMGGMGDSPEVDLISLHNRYLRASLERLLTQPNLGKAEELHKWYELQIRNKNIPHTPETVACMLKASLLSSRGSRLQRLIDRYMSMAPGDAGLEVLYMTDILTDQDRATITEVCQRYNLSPGEEQLAAELANSPVAESANSVEAERVDSAVIPPVLSTPQKGMGLRMIKQTLSLFSEIPQGRDIATLSLEERKEIQSRLERDCVDAAVDRWREENQALLKMGLNTSLSSASLNSRLYEWQRDLENRLTREMEMVDAAEAAESKNKEDMDRCLYGPFLKQSSPSRLAAVTILSTLSSLAMHGADKGVPLGVVINQLSKIAEEDIRAQIRSKESTSKKFKQSKVSARSALRKANSPLPEQAPVDDVQTNVINPEAYTDKSWPLAIKTKVGAALLSALIESAKVTVVKEDQVTSTLLSQVQPAFTHATQFKRGKKVGMLLPNQTLVELMKREPRGDFLARHLPMVVEPAPWSKFDKGGFLEYPTPLVRIKHGEKDQKIYTQAAIARGDMDQVLKGLDVLGRTAWNINKPVFDVMLEAWNTGEPIADIPALHPDIPTPPEPDSSDDPMQRRLWIKAVKAAENHRSGLHSVRCFMNFQLEIARAFRDQTFYFPHNIDFRGRAYPIPTYLNHMGADHVRGLMCFAKGKELGEEGLRWLKVHLANVYGFDKASLKEREAFAMDNVENIIDSATNPLKGKRWWLKAEDPWQCLATCYELKAALDCADPTQYISHLPVHQDGTCNGLQHYAALGGDTWGAQQVNLVPGDRPADVYSAVADLVKENIAADLEQGNPFAVALTGKITRKVVKQTVMTNVYGVTFSGAKKQVLKQLDALYPDLQSQTGLDPLILASYIATKIFKALSTMFRGAHDIQYWLGEIGGRVCRALTPDQLARLENQPTPAKKGIRAKAAKTSTEEILSQFRSTLVWTTPLRMPVAQPYRKSGTRTISTCLQDLILVSPESSDPVHRRKQLQAFPPNFIHSLDASHMILSALECDAMGLSFAAVHDSFWTHAADVNKMNGVIRDAFIRIHSEDVIGRLASEFEARYKGSIYLAKVNQNTPVAKKIIAFRKKARMSLRDELLLEKTRLQLLKSTDPEEVAEGKKMVTAASIFEEMSASEDIIEPEDMDEIGLGSIPANEKKSAEALEATTAEDIKHEDGDMEASTDEPEDRLQSLLGTDHFELRVTKPRPQQRAAEKTIQIWLPLTFPAIPEKGDFDVQRLKASEYFFS
ncbi:uncharacterized protein E0L32_000480 [Thyridium curvatum]|uniref:DNA-directed RNA polymerase n=1 Tax=Thyridium curvatum TaxID=1093900 RepID=A0A507B4S4_9PEZI|nr:uncharacterized protein E0L32_000480 [Thyridium curvatum]TPX14086.1 hypothetical protein E0L32_000480 [Thyridium curvatum]